MLASVPVNAVQSNSTALPTPPAEASGPLGWLRRWLTQRYSAQARAQRDEARRALKVAGVQFRTVFDQTTEGLVICDGQGQVLACNRVAAAMLGAHRSDLVGKPMSAHIRQGSADTPVALRSGEAQLCRETGEALPVDVRVHEIPVPDGMQWLVQMRDLSDQQRTQEHLTKLANYDSLTGLPNRALFRDRLAQAMKRAQRSGSPMALMFIDLDRFKVVNDSLGHEVGDRLLKHVAQTILQCLRGADSVSRLTNDEAYLVSRLGGDEFTVIAEGISGAEDAAAVAKRLLEALTTPFVVADEEIVVSASIGITTYPTDDVDLDTLLRHTDMAMYRAKSSGRDTYCFFSDDLNAAVSARLSMEGSLRRAIEREEFLLHYQPKADLRTGDVTCVETLIRWHCPGRGLVPPDRFIAVLEDTGLILQVGAWVIRTACAQLAAWDRAGMPPLRLAINVSARQFRHPFLVALVEDTLRECAIDPGRIEIELTESLLMEDTEATRGMLANFARIGLRLALDDFGTGHSSLAYLKRFRIDTLKIDRSFVTALPEDAEDRAIAGAVVALGHSMGMTVVAEGVETEAQRTILAELGCDEIQGYLLSRPLAPADFGDWMQRHLERKAILKPNRLAPEPTVTPITLVQDTRADEPAPATRSGDPVRATALAQPRPLPAALASLLPAAQPVVVRPRVPSSRSDHGDWQETQPGITVWALSNSPELERPVRAPRPAPAPAPASVGAPASDPGHDEEELATEAAGAGSDRPERRGLRPRRLTAAQRAAQAGAEPPARRRWPR